jgi:hypothetical protein
MRKANVKSLCAAGCDIVKNRPQLCSNNTLCLRDLQTFVGLIILSLFSFGLFHERVNCKNDALVLICEEISLKEVIALFFHGTGLIRLIQN